MTRTTEPVSENINRALVLFLGQGISPFPSKSEDRVLNEFGMTAGADLVAQARLLLAEIDLLQPDWSKQDLVSASNWAESQMKARHPAIDASGASALGWYFSWGWR